MSPRIDLVGKTFGRLQVISDVGRNKNKAVLWKCVCSCGQETITTGNKLTSGHTASCGCLHKEQIGALLRTHGKSKHPIYQAWRGMMKRCFYEKGIQYHDYGGRGITVCDRWQVFQAFYDDMIAGYQKGLQIDRIDNNGNYCLENCRWVTSKENNRNKRNCNFITCAGETKTLSEWAEITGLARATIRNRLKMVGCSSEEALKC